MTAYTETVRTKIPASTVVMINRNHKFGEDPAAPNGYDHGPITIAKAQKEGLLGSSGGTMSVRMSVAEGDFKGAAVEYVGDKFFAITYIEH